MTDEMMNLCALVKKAPDADLLREMIGFAAQRLMELEVAGLTGVAYGEKSVGRVWHSATATATGPGRPAPVRPSFASQAAQGKLLPRFAGAAPHGEKALTAVIQEAYVQGFSTRCMFRGIVSTDFRAS